jgi:hypothetical protein
MFEFAQWLENTHVSLTIKTVEWIVPVVQIIHIITIGIVFVSLLTIAMRVLGWTRMDQAFSVVMARFAPCIRRGLVILLLTGLTLVVGEPIRELMSLSFWLKMGLLALGVVSALRFSRSMRPLAALGQEPQFSSAARSAAVLTVLLWLAIIFLGRAIAYDVEVWGGLSLSPRA